MFIEPYISLTEESKDDEYVLEMVKQLSSREVPVSTRHA